MRLQNSFTVPADPDTVWGLLLDVPAVAPCVPGAELTEILDQRAYKGRAKVKVGPMLLTFAGTAQLTEVDDAARRARLRAKGTDEKGRGQAQAEVTFCVAPEAAGSRVDVVTDLSLVGAVAQYGRASGLLQGIAGEITTDFARNLETLIRSRQGIPEAAKVEAAPAAAPIGGLGLLWRSALRMLRQWFGALAARLPGAGR